MTEVIMARIWGRTNLPEIAATVIQYQVVSLTFHVTAWFS